jgi:exodeoxyribonuclease-3
LSKIGLSDVERGLGDDAEARFIGATCGPLRVYSCYVPNGRSLDNDHYQYKLKWLSDLATHLRARPNDQRIVVGGDFNVAPSDLDVYDPAAFVGATHVSEPERAAITELIDTGLVDIVREQHPGEPCFSWWDYRNGCFRRGWGLRIDLLLLDPVSAAATTSSYVDRDARKGEKPSDHAPVVVEIDDVL